MAPSRFIAGAILAALLTTTHAIPSSPPWGPPHKLQPPTDSNLDLCPYPAPPSPVVEDPPPLNPHLLDMDTVDDLINGMCADVILIFARGTGNPGNIGNTLGFPLITAMRSGLEQSVIAQGVLPYPARTIGYLQGGSREGVDSMVALTYKARCQCPDAGIVLAGFSQGAQVLRRAISYLPAPLAKSVVAVISFSDTKWPDLLPYPWNEKHISLCQKRDWICDKEYTALSGRHYSALYLPFLDMIVDQLQDRIEVMQWQKEREELVGNQEPTEKVDYCNIRGSHLT